MINIEGYDAEFRDRWEECLQKTLKMSKDRWIAENAINKAVTVKELIQALWKLPPDTMVFTYSTGNGVGTYSGVNKMTLGDLPYVVYLLSDG